MSQDARRGPGAGGRRACAWLLSAYRAASHAAWADWLVDAVTELDWLRFELPGRHFAWRIRGNPLSWLDAFPAEVPDRIVATSMVDLATILGLHPRLAAVPTLYYFHENQFAYPSSNRQVASLEPQMVQLYGALAADRVAFNSGYNRSTFLDGVQTMLDRMPDRVPTGVVDRLAKKAVVLPVPVSPIRPANDKDAGLIAWNHRWEYDKNPDRFAEAMLALDQRGADFRLALLGPRPQKTPSSLRRLRERLNHRIVADGRLPRGEYCETLARAAIVVSTAEHEFQGVSMLEAASAGCIPLVPDALVYPEIYPPPYRYPPGDAQALAERLAGWLAGPRPAPFDPRDWTGAELRRAWVEVLEQPEP